MFASLSNFFTVTNQELHNPTPTLCGEQAAQLTLKPWFKAAIAKKFPFETVYLSNRSGATPTTCWVKVLLQINVTCFW
jgi:hypothetical protein